MDTQLVKGTTENILLAAELLKRGEIVAIPTETVYGIAADASDGSAVKKIFLAKGRPQDNPLIVHIADFAMLYRVAAQVPQRAERLAGAFWPGPLTMILPRGEFPCDETCASLSSVGVRFPAHKTAQAVIRAAGVPLAAPSANLSGKPSPTNAADVYADMKGRLPLVLDGGECDAGVESTVVSLLGEKVTLLRPGFVTKEEMEEVLGEEVVLARAVTERLQTGEKVLSPGMKYKHYAPDAELVLVKGGMPAFIRYVEKRKADGTWCLCFEREEGGMPCPALSYGKEGDGAAQAHAVFARLRELDRLGARTVFVRCPADTGVSLAVYNRLLRAAAFRVVDAEKTE